MSGSYFFQGSILEKCGILLKNGRFSERIRPDWGSTTWAAMSGLGSIGLSKKPVGRQTRSSNKITFILRKPSSEKYKSCFSYNGFRAWNQLPASIQTLDEINCFKYRIKQLFSQDVKDTEGT